MKASQRGDIRRYPSQTRTRIWHHETASTAAIQMWHLRPDHRASCGRLGRI